LAGRLGGDPSDSNLIKVKGFILAGGFGGDPSESNLIKVKGFILAGGFGGDPSESNLIKAIRVNFEGSSGLRDEGWIAAGATGSSETGDRKWARPLPRPPPAPTPVGSESGKLGGDCERRRCGRPGPSESK
jgi:hypothetical protein